MQGEIVAIAINQNKEGQSENKNSVTLLTDIGIKENSVQKCGRQISVFSWEGREWMKDQPEPGLCFRRFSENILIKGLDLSTLEIGEDIYIGTAIIQKTGAKHCFDECVLRSKGKECLLSKNAFFASVKKDGEIQIGDVVKSGNNMING